MKIFSVIKIVWLIPYAKLFARRFALWRLKKENSAALAG